MSDIVQKLGAGWTEVRGEPYVAMPTAHYEKLLDVVEAASSYADLSGPTPPGVVTDADFRDREDLRREALGELLAALEGVGYV